MEINEANNLIGCCGLYCGLCNKYQSSAPSRCLGCKVGEQHAWCSIWNCCVRKRSYETCAQCQEIFACPIFLRRKVATWIPAAANLRQIQKIGLSTWLTGQIERQQWAEQLLQHYNDGRSMRFYCSACSRMPIGSIERALAEAEQKFKTEAIPETDLKSRATIVKSIFRELAATAGVNLDAK